MEAVTSVNAQDTALRHFRAADNVSPRNPTWKGKIRGGGLRQKSRTRPRGLRIIVRMLERLWLKERIRTADSTRLTETLYKRLGADQSSRAYIMAADRDLAILLEKISSELSQNPRLTLYAIARRIGVDRHRIEQAVRRNLGISFRELQKIKRLESALPRACWSAA